MVAPATTAVPRAESWLYSRLRTAVSPLRIYRSYSGKAERHVRYSYQGNTQLHYIAGSDFVATTWLVYVAQSVGTTTTLWAEDLKADADNIDDALDFAPTTTIDGRSIDGCMRESEHYFELWQNNVLQELQLGGYYRVYSSVVPP